MRMDLPPHRRFRTLDDFLHEDRLRERLAARAMLPGLAPIWGDSIVPGFQDYASGGTYSFTVPEFDSLTIELWGAGGRSSSGIGGGAAGGASTVTALGLSAGGGSPGSPGSVGYNATGAGGAGGAGGGASGGDVNTTGATGGAGQALSPPRPGTGGAGGAGAPGRTGLGSRSAGGGTAGANGGQSTSGEDDTYTGGGGGGGSGGYLRKTYTAALLAKGTVLSIVVGARSGGNPGRCYIFWS